MSPSEQLARRTFLASGEGPGPLALRIVRRAKGNAGLVSVEALGRLPAHREPGAFYSQLDRLNPIEDGVFVDFGDLAALRGHACDLARQGLALCQATRGPVASDAALELLAHLATWEAVIELQRVPDPQHLLRAIQRRPGPLDVAAVVHALLFDRLPQVAPQQRQTSDVQPYFGSRLHELGKAMEAASAAFYAQHRAVQRELQEHEQKLRELKDRKANIDGGSLNPAYLDLEGHLWVIQNRIDQLRETEGRAQRLCWLDEAQAAGRRRRELYAGEPAPQEQPPAA